MDAEQPLPLSACCCQNERCPDYGKKGWGNLYQHHWVDRQTKRIRHLRCRTCRRECAERKGTPWYRAHVTPEQGRAVAQHLAEGDGMRKTARLVGGSRIPCCGGIAGSGSTVRPCITSASSTCGCGRRKATSCGPSWGNQEARCDRADPADEGKGSPWDHTVVETETKLAVSLVIGPRSQANAEALWRACAQRTDHERPALSTTDEARVYAGAILTPYGLPTACSPTGKPGRPRQPRLVPLRALVYALGHKLQRKGRVVKVMIRRVFGTARALARALAQSAVSTHVNTSFVERFNATGRQHNSRKARTVYTCSKDCEPHVAMSWFATSCDNCCRPHLG